MTSYERSVLIGHTGYVGSTLLRQRGFDSLFNSSNVAQLAADSYQEVVCCAAPAQKWMANRDPLADRENIQRLIEDLDRLDCDRFIHISTVDVFKSPFGVDEATTVDEQGLHAYGLNRRLLEQFVASRFRQHLIVRLPGLVGPGLRKNIVFDLLNDNAVEKIDSRHTFQFYPMVNLWFDIEIALQANLRLIHLTAEPVSVQQVAEYGFNRPFEQIVAAEPISYDMRTCHAGLFGGSTGYQYSLRESLQAIRAYAQSEPGRLGSLRTSAS
jgi:nucleoside-diphosphate-sugar epimerase